MVDWYSFVILDVIGDLAFNDQFNCLETSKMHVSLHSQCQWSILTKISSGQR